MNEETKVCQNTDCGKEFTRTVSARGKKEPMRFWVKRQFCGNSCANKGRWQVHFRNLIEDVEWIIGTDHPESIAKRVHYKNAKDLAHILREKGRGDLADRLQREMARYNNPVLTERDVYGRFTGLATA